MKTHQNSWAATKVIPRKEFTALNAYIRKEKRPEINYPHFHLKKLENEQFKPE